SRSGLLITLSSTTASDGFAVCAKKLSYAVPKSDKGYKFKPFYTIYSYASAGISDPASFNFCLICRLTSRQEKSKQNKQYFHRLFSNLASILSASNL
ncbi:hypothetical protein, partial [uncultured Campylobacter sp.]|uniref:hypothetical protein n=1 Tax=uncultured Campylobacter sp. TaxID=218934 RepID=UPI0026138A99